MPSVLATESATVYAKKATVKFFDGLEVDGYRMPDGSFRVGVTGVSRTLGYAKNWLGRVIKRDGHKLKALQEQGFEPNFRRAATKSGRPPETMSIEDFSSFILVAIQDGKKSALALHKALIHLSLTDFFRDAFGQVPLSIHEKRELFYRTYAASISPGQWMQMDKEDILALALPGDESHLLNWSEG